MLVVMSKSMSQENSKEKSKSQIESIQNIKMEFEGLTSYHQRELLYQLIDIHNHIEFKKEIRSASKWAIEDGED